MVKDHVCQTLMLKTQCVSGEAKNFAGDEFNLASLDDMNRCWQSEGFVMTMEENGVGNKKATAAECEQCDSMMAT